MNREQLEEIRARAAGFKELLDADVEDGDLAIEVAKDVPALLDEIDRLQKRVDEEERDCMTVIRERDEFGGVADKLAAAIGAMTGNDLGEHGSGNDPWRNALDLARGYIAHQAKRCAEMSTTAEGSAEGGTGEGR